MGIREERSRVRTRLAFLTSREQDALTRGTPAAPEWLSDSRVAETGATNAGLTFGDDNSGFDGIGDDSSWSARRRWGVLALPDRWRNARIDPGRAGAIALIVVGIVVVMVAVVSVRSGQAETQAVPSLPDAYSQPPLSSAEPSVHDVVPPVPTEPTPAEEIVVSVVGLVASSGLIRLPAGSRVADALDAAGGVRDGGDTLGLNLAQRLSDGDQVLVGAAASAPPPSAVGGGAGGTGSEIRGAATSGAIEGPVNVNTATESELDALSGVGPVTAAAIVAWRTVNGKFTDISQLGEVDGIGPVRLAKLRPQVTL
ncbi:competence protein ComEA [Rhodococcus sp. WMMA185]|uniref:ComEA family DNA-binding protein n=1 Tax=Rhodococcus sp. WMMA185 TaxID=679318 RepID=UPI0008790029|nr:ComEA family DNA-binding protein [Rhodococcus sp. WMMA185]AOW92952.1 competence protein ComEA [Rhodococcus sp. WMMA185]